MKAYLINDTDNGTHAGCAAVMRSLRAALAAVPGLDLSGNLKSGSFALEDAAWEEADVIFINGEGSIHHSSERALFLLTIIEEAKKAGKKVLLVNALFQQYECPQPDILADLALLSVREPRSFAFSRRFGGEPLLLLDSAADPAFLDDGKAIPLNHGTVIGGSHRHGLIDEPFEGVRGHILTLADASFPDLVATLRGAEIYLTAQHHGVYAAALAGCPFVVTPSNSHKIESFIEWTGLPIPICLAKHELGPAMGYAKRNKTMFAELQGFLRENSVLTTAMIMEALR